MPTYVAEVAIFMQVTIDNIPNIEDAKKKIQSDCEEALAKTPHQVDIGEFEFNDVWDEGE